MLPPFVKYKARVDRGYKCTIMLDVEWGSSLGLVSQTKLYLEPVNVRNETSYYGAPANISKSAPFPAISGCIQRARQIRTKLYFTTTTMELGITGETPGIRFYKSKG